MSTQNHSYIFYFLLITRIIAASETEFNLIRAARNGNIDTIKKALEEGVNINCVEAQAKVTPLFAACINHKLEAAQFLIDKGADVRIPNKRGLTPLHMTCQVKNLPIAELLLRQGADANSKNNDGNTSLHYACELNDPRIAELLLNNRGNANIKNGQGVAPLHLACQQKSPLLAQLLIKHGVDVNLQAENGSSPLHTACQVNNPAIAELLISNRADTNMQTNCGFTPLHIACQVNNPAMVELLIGKGADVNITNHEGVSPLHMVSYFAAPGEGQEAIITKLLSAGANINAQMSDGGSSALKIAIVKGNESLVQLLLNAGAEDNPDQEQQMAIDIAILSNQEKILKLLLEREKKKKAQDNNKWVSRLTLAMFSGNEKILDLLIRNGYKINTQDEKGNTSLHYAQTAEQAKLIIDRKGDWTIKNHAQMTPRATAAARHNDKVAEFILQKQKASDVAAKLLCEEEKRSSQLKRSGKKSNTMLSSASSSSKKPVATFDNETGSISESTVMPRVVSEVEKFNSIFFTDDGSSIETIDEDGKTITIKDPARNERIVIKNSSSKCLNKKTEITFSYSPRLDARMGFVSMDGSSIHNQLATDEKIIHDHDFAHMLDNIIQYCGTIIKTGNAGRRTLQADVQRVNMDDSSWVDCRAEYTYDDKNILFHRLLRPIRNTSNS